MRREGYEFAVSKAEVLYHTDERGKKLEPMELAYIDVPDDCTGSVIQKLSQRKGELLGMSPINGGYTRLQFSIPSRGLIGYRGEFLTDTKGNGIINSSFEGYEEYTFKGSEIDRSFSFSKLDKCFGDVGLNTAGNNRQIVSAPVQEPAQTPGKADSPLLAGLGGLFSAPSSPADETPDNPGERKKKKKKRHSHLPNQQQNHVRHKDIQTHCRHVPAK